MVKGCMDIIDAALSYEEHWSLSGAEFSVTYLLLKATFLYDHDDEKKRNTGIVIVPVANKNLKL